MPIRNWARKLDTRLGVVRTRTLAEGLYAGLHSQVARRSNYARAPVVLLPTACESKTWITGILRAGPNPWPQLLQNMRTSRATKLAAEFPTLIAAQWTGHFGKVSKEHHWRATLTSPKRSTRLERISIRRYVVEWGGTKPQAKRKKPREMQYSPRLMRFHQ